MAKNYYAVLGVAQGASDDEIRRRFKELARDRHPDRFRDQEKRQAEAAFQDLTEAFNVLTDPSRRRAHDLELTHPSSRASQGSGTSATAGRDRTQLIRTYLARGVQAYKEGNFNAAAESFDRATQVDPRNPQAWYNLAMACSRQERWLSRGVTAIEKACEIEPMKPSYRKLAGRLCARAGKSERAEEHFKEALTWGGQDAEVERALDELRTGSKRRGFFGKVI